MKSDEQKWSATLRHPLHVRCMPSEIKFQVSAIKEDIKSVQQDILSFKLHVSDAEVRCKEKRDV
jgi:hypothetical protein